MEKLAEGLQKLSEDDLLHVVTMVHDNKTAETYTKNDVESMFAVHSSCHILIGVRRRVPRRPLHPPRLSRQDAVGVYGLQDRHLGDQHARSNRKPYAYALDLPTIPSRYNSSSPRIPRCNNLEQSRLPTLGWTVRQRHLFSPRPPFFLIMCLNPFVATAVRWERQP
jgi:hypothetical protein